MKKKIEFQAMSSNGVTKYTITAIENIDGFTMFCSCPAGEKKKFCKHKIWFLNNDPRILATPDQRSELDSFFAQNKDSSVLLNFEKYVEAENAQQSATACLEIIKKTLEQSMSKGNT